MKEKVTLTITKLGNDGEGIADFGGKPIFVYNSLPGEIVLVKPSINSRGAFEGDIIEITKKSKYRQRYPFVYPNNSIGMNLIHLQYNQTVKYKNDKVMYHFRKALGKDICDSIKFDHTIPASQNLFYRFDTILPLGQKNGKLVWGMYEVGSNIIAPTKLLLNQTKLINDIANKTVNLLNELNLKSFHSKSKTGVLKYLKIRQNLEGQIELCLVIHHEIAYNLLASKIKETMPEVIKFSFIINDKVKITNPLAGTQVPVYGPTFFPITINGIKYNVSTDAFFQLNLTQASILNKEVINIANFSDSENVVDGYSGVGSISMPVAPLVKSVTQIELTPSACKAAKETIKNLQYQNIFVINSDFTSWFAKPCNTCDTLIIDPPRRGLSKELISTINHKLPSKIIYVSCEIETLVRDLKLLEKNYRIEKVKSIDMFPYTPHVEVISLLTVKTNNSY